MGTTKSLAADLQVTGRTLEEKHMKSGVTKFLAAAAATTALAATSAFAEKADQLVDINGDNAARLGYSEPSAFIRAFKQTMKVSPAKWRVAK